MKRKTPSKDCRFVISVVVPDRVGILRDISAAVSDLAANIDGISQTVVEGYFTVLLTATFKAASSANDIAESIRGRFNPDEASVMVRPHVKAPVAPCVGGERFILTMTGKDRPGILRAVTAFLAERHINIEDWYVSFEGPNVMHIGEVTLPGRLDVQQLQADLSRAMARLEMQVHVHHENIFRATNDIGPINRLITEAANGSGH
jgi:predicted amino acid-binding ACT domain protein